MPRLLGVDIPGQKRIEYALRYIYGIGPTRSRLIVEESKIDASKKADDLSPEELRTLIGIVQTRFRVEGDLRREVSQNIRRLISIGSYRGTRHRRGLPVRGQWVRCAIRKRGPPRRKSNATREQARRWQRKRIRYPKGIRLRLRPRMAALGPGQERRRMASRL
jgi:small subunit ribosomal protein S13